MKEFIRGWRRKIGCVTLLMACVAMVGQIRSYTTVDVVDLPIEQNWSLHSVSSLGWFTTQCCLNESQWAFPRWWSQPIAENHRPLFHWSNTFGSPFEVRWERYGFGYGEYIDIDDGQPTESVWAIPYWSITAPLSLISLYLLVRNLLPSTQTKTAQPINDDVGGATS